jgi:hypothetical protein
MNFDFAFDRFIARAEAFIRRADDPSAGDNPGAEEFNTLALELFALQFDALPIYRSFCNARGVVPGTVKQWNEIPALPASAFKDCDVTSLAGEDRGRVFFSSGTSGQARSRHFHNSRSLALYEASLLPWFGRHLKCNEEEVEMVFLAPAPSAAPNSSLVYMFDTIARNAGRGGFFASVGADGSWIVNRAEVCAALSRFTEAGRKVALLGPAFSFVHLLDELESEKVSFKLPKGSRVMETGGYKGRSRALTKEELHGRISAGLGVGSNNIVTEYGMSELSSQAYDGVTGDNGPGSGRRVFKFPPWARAEIISTETGEPVAEGGAGLLRIFDLANARSVAAIETADLAIRRGAGFELAGRAASAEPRGCSLALQEI